MYDVPLSEFHLLLALFQLVWIRDSSSPVFQQSSRPAPLFLLHPPELTMSRHHYQGHPVLAGIHLSGKLHVDLPVVSPSPLQFLH